MKFLILATILLVASAKIVLYQKCDPRWGRTSLGTGSSTICSRGDAVVIMASILATWDVGCETNPCTPGVLNKFMIANNFFSNRDLVQPSSIKCDGMSFQGSSSTPSTWMSKVQDPSYAVLLQLKNSTYRFVLGLQASTSTGQIQVHDPASGKKMIPYTDVSKAYYYKKNW